MDVFRIEGPVQLSGSIRTNGSKNAALPIMAAAMLAEGKTTLRSVPRLSDIELFGELMNQLGCRVERAENGDFSLDCSEIDNPVG